MSLTKARNLIELVRRLRDEKVIDNSIGKQNLDELLKQNVGDEVVYTCLLIMKKTLNNYDSTGVPYVFCYDKKMDTISYYVVN
jgi:hypothetical protein